MNRAVAKPEGESQQSASRRLLNGATPQGKPLSGTELVAYGLPWLPAQLVLLVLVIYLPSFYAIDAGVSIAVVGAMFFAARLWDVVTNTLIGGFSDSWQTRWGRRKPWIAAGTPALLLAATFLFMPPAGKVSGAYLGVWLFLFYLAYDVVQIPYAAWGADLSSNYVERNRIVGVREALGTMGIVLGTALPLLLLHGNQQNLRGVLHTALIAIMVILPPTVFFALAFVRREEQSPSKNPRFSWRTLVDVVVGNPLFVRFIVAFLLWATAWNMFLAAIVIFIEYVLGLKNQYLSLVLVMNLAASVGMPVALRVARRIDKHVMFAAGMCGFVVFYGLLSIMPARHYWTTFAVFLGLGMCWAPVLANNAAMIPDMVDVAMLRRKRGETGVYMAVFFLLQKLAQALGIGLGLPLLQVLGFSVTNPSSTAGIHAFHVVTLYVPAIMTIPAAYLLFTFPLNRKRHLVVRRWLDRSTNRRGSGSSELS